MTVLNFRFLLLLCGCTRVLAYPPQSSPAPSLSVLEQLKSGSALVPVISAPDTHIIGKRDQDLVAVHGAIIFFHCLIGGDMRRSFIWRANYDHYREELTLTTVRSIDAWDHLDVFTNDFSTRWHHRFCWSTHEHCCIYTIRAKVVGELYTDRIVQWLVTDNEDDESRIKIVEYCVSSCGEQCAAHETPNHIHFTECTVLSTSEYS